MAHLHIPHLLHHGKEQQQISEIHKDCVAIMVGKEGVEERQKFLVPVTYFNHQLFVQLLKEVEKEYEYDHKGIITLPCHVEEFKNVRGMIERERSLHHHHHALGCFRA